MQYLRVDLDRFCAFFAIRLAKNPGPLDTAKYKVRRECCGQFPRNIQGVDFKDNQTT